MGEFFVYSFKVALCLAVFCVFYKLMLSRTTFHAFNRFVILALIFMSLLLPFVHITLEQPDTLAANITVEPLLVMLTEPQESVFAFSMMHLAVVIYIVGVVVFALRMAVSYIHLYMILNNVSEVVDGGDGTRIYIHRGSVSPFNWFRNVVISESDYSDADRQVIITHEKAHAIHRHSVDILLCNLLTVVQWFNPAAWLLKTCLQDVHEYEADEEVMKSGIGAAYYQLLLVRKAVGGQLFAIADNLSKDSLKKRIKMMKTKRTNRWESMKVLVVLPLSVIAVVAFASPDLRDVEQNVVSGTDQMVHAVQEKVAEPVNYASQVLVDETADKIERDSVRSAGKKDKVYDVVEKLPSFSGGISAMMKYLVDNVKYPKEAEKNNEQGRVIVRFVVNEDGSINDAQVVKSVSPSLDAEALRVIGSMPKWEPGMQDGKNVKVKFVLPVVFRLDDHTPKNTADASTTETILVNDSLKTK